VDAFTLSSGEVLGGEFYFLFCGGVFFFLGFGSFAFTAQVTKRALHHRENGFDSSGLVTAVPFTDSSFFH
jgi:hypothetical protein